MDAIVAQARSWIDATSAGVEEAGVDEEERKITFKTPSRTFYVTVPQQLGEDEWAVWSSEEQCVEVLCVEMEKLCRRSNSICDILETVLAILDSSSQQNKMSVDDEEDYDDDDDCDDDDYYASGDDEAVPRSSSYTSPEADEATNFFTGEGSPVAVHRLLTDLKALSRSSSKYGISGNPIDDNLFLWKVELSDFPSESLLAKDLLTFSSSSGHKPVVTMEMKFPKDYPMNPPFVRILRPRFKFLTGHVTIGGSICMQMLTRSGWFPTNDIESILVQIRAEIMSDPRARLELGRKDDYSEIEAKAAFERMVMKYGWHK